VSFPHGGAEDGRLDRALSKQLKSPEAVPAIGEAEGAVHLCQLDRREVAAADAAVLVDVLLGVDRSAVDLAADLPVISDGDVGDLDPQGLLRGSAKGFVCVLFCHRVLHVRDAGRSLALEDAARTTNRRWSRASEEKLRLCGKANQEPPFSVQWGCRATH
jgi:hypothetical protein